MIIRVFHFAVVQFFLVFFCCEPAQHFVRSATTFYNNSAYVPDMDCSKWTIAILLLCMFAISSVKGEEEEEEYNCFWGDYIERDE